jgi:homoserine dehydrogenase
MSNKQLTVALLGFGVVGSGTAQVITENQDRICRATGRGIDIRYILDLREFPDSPFADRIVHDFNIILNDPEVDVVVEMMGGSHPAYDFSRAALEAGKSVVTSNKEVVANFGTELLALAKEKGVRYLFEASVGGGIPVLRPLSQDMAANRVCAVNGILNGTTNYILTRMKSGASFDEVLTEAQALGYAERDPSADVDGLDAARKIVILAAMSTGLRVDPNTISVEGIRSISASDVEIAAELGCTIKLIGHMTYDATSDKLSVWVAPCMVPAAHPLHHIDDVFNGILIDTDMLGQTLFYGRGAGKLPTAGAVVSDLTDIAMHPFDAATAPCWSDADGARLLPAGEEKLPVCLIYEGGLDTLPAAEAQQVVTTDTHSAMLLPAMTQAEVTSLIQSKATRPVAQYRVLPL